MPRANIATCPDCKHRFPKRPGESAGERATRMKVHRGSGHCRAAATRARLKVRDMELMEHSDYKQGYHDLKAADLIEKHQTKFERGILHHQAWGPRWASEYVQFIRSSQGPGKPRGPQFNQRVAELKALAAEPDGPDRARVLMALSGHDRD